MLFPCSSLSNDVAAPEPTVPPATPAPQPPIPAVTSKEDPKPTQESDTDVITAPPPRGVLRRIDSAKSASATAVLEDFKKADDTENITLIAPKPRNKPFQRASTINLPPTVHVPPAVPEPARRSTFRHFSSYRCLYIYYYYYFFLSTLLASLHT